MGYSNGVYTPPTGATNASAGQIIRSATWNTVHGDMANALTTVGSVSIEFVIGGTSVGGISTGVQGYLEVPMNLTINSWKLMANTSGSIVVDIWKVPFASFPPNSGNSITASAIPALVSAQSNSSSTLTGWTTTLTKADILAFNVNSVSGLNQVSISLDCGRNN